MLTPENAHLLGCWVNTPRRWLGFILDSSPSLECRAMPSTDETGSGEKGRSPTVFLIVGVAATLIVTSAVVLALVAGGHALSDNAALIGAVVALGGVFTAQLVGIALEDVRTREARELEAQRAREAAELETRRAREVALQRYFEDVGELLIEKPLRQANPGDNLSTVVRAQTLTVVQGLDGGRKRILLQFLYESGLICRDEPVVSLKAADLRWAWLIQTDLSGADLSGADLSGAHLSAADLGMANLSDTKLTWAADKATDLSGANLRGANLSKANLRWAKGITNEELEQQAASLKSAIMPDGSKHP
jgi:hypothetical protein